MHERENISNEAENNDKSSISTKMSMEISKRKEVNSRPYYNDTIFQYLTQRFWFLDNFRFFERKGNSIEANFRYPFSFFAFKFIQNKSKNRQTTATVNVNGKPFSLI